MPHKIEIFGIIGIEWAGVTAKQVVDRLTEIEADTESDNDVELHINSGGGFVDDAVQIYNRLRAHPGEIIVHIDALAASAATIIALAGDLIVAPKNAQLMVHRPWGMAVGDADDMRDGAGYLDMTEESMVQMYAARTGLSEAEVSDLLAAETWMTADRAKELGFVDEVTALHTGPNDEENGVEARMLNAVAEYQRAAATEDRLEEYRNPPASIAEVARAARDKGIPHLKKQQSRDRTRIRANADLIKGLKKQFDDLRQGNDVKPKTKNTNESPEEVPEETPEEVSTEPEVDEAPPAETPTTEDGAVARERARSMAITGLCEQHGVSSDVRNELIKTGASVNQAQARVLNHLATRQKEGVSKVNPIQVNVDETENRAEGIKNALFLRAQMLGKEEARKERGSNQFARYRLGELAMMFSKRRHGDRMSIIGEVLNSSRPRADLGISHTSDDFGNILADVAHKSMLIGWDQTEATFEPWTNRGILTDFKATTRVGMNLFPDLLKIEEGGEYKGATVNDRGVTMQLGTYGRMFGITRQAIINDDIEAITTIPRKMGQAARRTVANLVYGVLTDNGNFSDGTALFHADHNNENAVALDADGLDALETAMMTQKDPDTGTALSIMPSYLLVPAALKREAREQLFGAFISDGSVTISNVHPGDLEIIVEPRLDQHDATNWYLAASGAQHDTVEVSYLDGNDQPFLEQTTAWNVDGSSFKARIDVGAGARDFRGLQRSTGV